MSALLKPQILSYRPEIDCLRAIAVLAVMFYHAGFGFLPNGFLGVDIFFVISGYLITGILITDLEAKQFSLLHFYERRARRILPALSLVVLVSAVCAWFWLLPHELEAFGNSVFATALFHSNFYFASTSGYFATASEELPLLHTWSLAVEEQFYFVFPLLLWAAWRYFGAYFRRLFIPLLLLATVASFIYFLGNAAKNDAVYYWPHARAWELLLGVMVAFGLQGKPLPEASIKVDVLPLLGLLLVYLAMTAKLKYNVLNIGLLTLQACLGAVLLLYFGRAKGLVNHILSSRVLVFVGLISYSAYLWHFPIFAFARLQFNYQPASDWGFALILACLLLAWLSWLYVEQPFRKNKNISKRKLVTTALISITALALTGCALKAEQGHINRASMQKIKAYAEVRAQKGWGERYCEAHNLNLSWAPVVCLIGDPSQTPSGVVWGDSLGGSLIYGMNQALKEKKIAFLAVVSNACPPIEGLNHPKYDCHKLRHQQTIQKLISDNSLRHLVWIGNFVGAMNSSGTPINIGNQPTTPALVQQSMLNTLKQLSKYNKKVVLVKTPPIMPLSVPEFYMRKKLNKQKGELMISAKNYQAFVAPLNPIIIGKPSEVSIINSEKFFCDANYCYARNNKDELLFMDTNHFSQKKSLQISKAVIKELLKS